MVDTMLNQDRNAQIGQTISTYREAAEKTVVKTAALLGISPEEYLQFERGETSPSLPQLEALAFFFKVPLNNLLEPSEHPLKPRIDLAGIPELLALRNKIISSILKKSRLDKAIAIEDLAFQTGLSVEEIQAYELDQAAIPQAKLESLCSILGIKLEELQSSLSLPSETSVQNPVGQIQNPTLTISDELASFFADANNHPYLELAMKLSKLDAARIREIAESLLEITY